MRQAQNTEQLEALFRRAVSAHQEKRFGDAQAAYKKILQAVPRQFDVLHLLGQAYIEDGRPGQAISWLKRAVQVDDCNADACYDLGLAYRLSGQHASAADAYRRTLELEPDRLQAHLSLVEMKLPGPHYTEVLRDLHTRLAPATYLEIGVETGQSMALAQATTRCIGVDPQPDISVNLPPDHHIFAQTSDSFFAEHSMTELFSGRSIDFAFIDGMHLFEAALRDFINVERHAARDSVIAIHDCLPLDAATSSRQRTTTFWSGDVWKLILVLKQYRPDLRLANVACKPTGLGLITALDPHNRVLETHYDRIVQEMHDRRYDDFQRDERQVMNVIDNDAQRIALWLQEARSGLSTATCAEQIA